MQPQVVISGLLFLLVAGVPPFPGAGPPSEGTRFFATQVQPILQAHCI
jgi:hypothetical protein